MASWLTIRTGRSCSSTHHGLPRTVPASLSANCRRDNRDRVYMWHVPLSHSSLIRYFIVLRSTICLFSCIMELPVCEISTGLNWVVICAG